jgi:predicted ATPase
MAASRSTGSKVFVPTFLPHLAMAHGQLGRFDESRLCIDEAIAAVETTKEGLWEAEVYLRAGEIARGERDIGRAEISFQRALSVERDQRAKSWELRAATSLARLWRDQGRRAEAHDLLAPAYHWFTEGFHTLDLIEAKALLAELRP